MTKVDFLNIFSLFFEKVHFLNEYMNHCAGAINYEIGKKIHKKAEMTVFQFMALYNKVP